MSSPKGNLRVGTSGYQYDHWVGVLYPDDLPKNQWFDRYAEVFDCVEINNTFYNLPEPGTFEKWRDAAPEGFEFVLKYSRYGTHMKRLKDPEDHIGVFLDAAEHLDDRLGPILVQLRPNWQVNPERLEKFLEAAPHRHRWAVEFRDPSWLRDDVYDLLRHHGAALCQHDMLDDHPEIVTTDWVYLRYHGRHYGGCYTPQKLSAEAQRIRDWLDDGLDVYAFFNNDVDGHAVPNARDLRRYATE